MTNNDRIVLAQGMHQPDHIADQVLLGVGLDRFRLIRVTVTPLIRCNNVVTRSCEGGQLVPPAVPTFWKTMT